MSHALSMLVNDDYLIYFVDDIFKKDVNGLEVRLVGSMSSCCGYLVSDIDSRLRVRIDRSLCKVSNSQPNAVFSLFGAIGLRGAEYSVTPTCAVKHEGINVEEFRRRWINIRPDLPPSLYSYRKRSGVKLERCTGYMPNC